MLRLLPTVREQRVLARPRAVPVRQRCRNAEGPAPGRREEDTTLAGRTVLGATKGLPADGRQDGHLGLDVETVMPWSDSAATSDAFNTCRVMDRTGLQSKP